MKIINELPPIYDQILAAGMKPSPTTVFAYEDAIYNPSGGEIPDDIKAHEAVHLKQQEEAGGADLWWERYMSEPYFRLEQEADAYATQYVFVRKFYPMDRNRLALVMIQFSKALSGPMYGNMISQATAERMIRDRI